MKTTLTFFNFQIVKIQWIDNIQCWQWGKEVVIVIHYKVNANNYNFSGEQFGITY